MLYNLSFFELWYYYYLGKYIRNNPKPVFILQNKAIRIDFLSYARTNYGKINIRFEGSSIWNNIEGSIKSSSALSFCF